MYNDYNRVPQNNYENLGSFYFDFNVYNYNKDRLYSNDEKKNEREHNFYPNSEKFYQERHYDQEWKEKTRRFIENMDLSQNWRSPHRFNVSQDKRMFPPKRPSFPASTRPREFKSPKRRRRSHLDDVHRDNYDYDECERIDNGPSYSGHSGIKKQENIKSHLYRTKTNIKLHQKVETNKKHIESSNKTIKNDKCEGRNNKNNVGNVLDNLLHCENDAKDQEDEKNQERFERQLCRTEKNNCQHLDNSNNTDSKHIEENTSEKKMINEVNSQKEDIETTESKNVVSEQNAINIEKITRNKDIGEKEYENANSKNLKTVVETKAHDISFVIKDHKEFMSDNNECPLYSNSKFEQGSYKKVKTNKQHEIRNKIESEVETNNVSHNKSEHKSIKNNFKSCSLEKNIQIDITDRKQGFISVPSKIVKQFEQNRRDTNTESITMRNKLFYNKVKNLHDTKNKLNKQNQDKNKLKNYTSHVKYVKEAVHTGDIKKQKNIKQMSKEKIFRQSFKNKDENVNKVENNSKSNGHNDINKNKSLPNEVIILKTHENTQRNIGINKIDNTSNKKSLPLLKSHETDNRVVDCLDVRSKSIINGQNKTFKINNEENDKNLKSDLIISHQIQANKKESEFNFYNDNGLSTQHNVDMIDSDRNIKMEVISESVESIANYIHQTQPVNLSLSPSLPIITAPFPTKQNSQIETHVSLEDIKIIYQEKLREIESDEETVHLNLDISIDAIDTKKSYLQPKVWDADYSYVDMDIGTPSPISEILTNKKEMNSETKSSNIIQNVDFELEIEKPKISHYIQGQELSGIKRRRQSDEIKSHSQRRSKFKKADVNTANAHLPKDRNYKCNDSSNRKIDTVPTSSNCKQSRKIQDRRHSDISDRKNFVNNLFGNDDEDIKQTDQLCKELKRRRESSDSTEIKKSKQNKGSLKNIFSEKIARIENIQNFTEEVLSLPKFIFSLDKADGYSIALEDCTDQATILESPDIQDNIETIKINTVNELDDVIEIKDNIPIVDLTQDLPASNNLKTELYHTSNPKLEKDDKQNLINILEQSSQLCPGEIITLYRSEETLNNSFEVQATVVSISASNKQNIETNKLLKIEPTSLETIQVSSSILKDSSTSAHGSDKNTASLENIKAASVNIVTNNVNLTEQIANLTKELQQPINNSYPVKQVDPNLNQAHVIVTECVNSNSMSKQTVIDTNDRCLVASNSRNNIQQVTLSILDSDKNPQSEVDNINNPDLQSESTTAITDQVTQSKSILENQLSFIPNPKESLIISETNVPYSVSTLPRISLMCNPINKSVETQSVGNRYSVTQRTNHPRPDNLRSIADAFIQYVCLYDTIKKAENAYVEILQKSKVMPLLVRRENETFNYYQNLKLKKLSESLVNILTKIPTTLISNLQLFVNYIFSEIQKKIPGFPKTWFIIILNNLMEQQKEFYTSGIFHTLYIFICKNAEHIYHVGRKSQINVVRRERFTSEQIKTLQNQISFYNQIRQVSVQSHPIVESQNITVPSTEPGNNFLHKELLHSQTCIESTPTENDPPRYGICSNQSYTNQTNMVELNSNFNNFSIQYSQIVSNSIYPHNLKQFQPSANMLSKNTLINKPGSVNSFQNIQHANKPQIGDAVQHNSICFQNNKVQIGSECAEYDKNKKSLNKSRTNPTKTGMVVGKSSELFSAAHELQFSKTQTQVHPPYNFAQDKSAELSSNTANLRTLLSQPPEVRPTSSTNSTNNDINCNKYQNLLNPNVSIKPSESLKTTTQNSLVDHKPQNSLQENKLDSEADYNSCKNLSLENSSGGSVNLKSHICSKESAVINSIQIDTTATSTIETRILSSDNSNLNTVSNKSELSTTQDLSKNKISFDEEIIDLTWIDDVDPEQIKNEISMVFKVEPAEESEEVILNQEQFPDDNYNELLQIERLCICEKPAQYVCGCRMAMYCSGVCQQKHWKAHKSLCLKYTVQKSDQ